MKTNVSFNNFKHIKSLVKISDLRKLGKKNIRTADGSRTFYIEELKETYHSRHGALTESCMVYLKEGLKYWINKNQKINCQILELGYGTGLIAYLTFLESEKKQNTIEYTSLEAYPLLKDELVDLKYNYLFGKYNYSKTFDDFSKLDWDIKQKLTSNFSLIKKEISFEEFNTKKSFDIIFYDAFGAHAQPELWESKWMKKCFELLNPGGVWVSYCSKGIVRRSLEAAGFNVSRIPGPPGKREMLRGVKS